MNPLKSFLAGLVFPAVVLPFFYLFLYFWGIGEIPNAPVQFVPLFLPLLFGIVNLFYVKINEQYSGATEDRRLWWTGIVMGLAVAVLGVFVLDLPILLFRLSGGWQYVPLVLAPLLYGLIWRYVIKALNRYLKVEE